MSRSLAVLLTLALLGAGACQWIAEIGERRLSDPKADAGSVGGAGGMGGTAGDASVPCSLAMPTGPSVRAGNFLESKDRVRFCLTRSDGLELVLPTPSPGCPSALAYKQVSAPVPVEDGMYSVKVVPEKDDCGDPALALLDQLELGDASATLRYWQNASAVVDSIDESDPVKDAVHVRFAHLAPAKPSLDFGEIAFTQVPTPITQVWFAQVPLGDVSRPGFGASPINVSDANGYVEIADKGGRFGAAEATGSALIATWVDGPVSLGHALSLYVLGGTQMEPLLCDETRIEDGLTWCGRGSDVRLSGATLAVGWELAGDPTFKARQKALLDSFAEGRFTSDFLCLQEIWSYQALGVSSEGAVVTAYPFASVYESDMSTPFSDPRDLAGAVPAPLSPPCSGGETSMEALLDCLRDECAVPGDDLSTIKELDCVSTSCGPEWQSVVTLPNGRCAGCVEVLLRGANIADVRKLCPTLPNPLAFEGSSGTLLLSKHPIESESHFVIPSTYVRKDVIHARVRHASSALPVDVYCAYSPPAFEFADYHGAYGSAPNGIQQTGSAGWAAEQELFVQYLLDNTVGFNSAVFVLGSLGVGPEYLPDVAGAHPQLFAGLVATPLLRDLIVSGYEPACTFCPDNPLFSKKPAPVWIDHGLGNSALKPVAMQRIATDAYVGVAGVGSVPLSRHYGLEVTVTTQP